MYVTNKKWCLHADNMVIWVAKGPPWGMGRGEETPLSEVRLCGIEVRPSGALDVSEISN